MFLKWQRNIIFQELLKLDIQPSAFEEYTDSQTYQLKFSSDIENLRFHVRRLERESRTYYVVTRRPGYSSKPEVSASFHEDNWSSIIPSFVAWARDVKQEIEAPDLWLEATKTAQLFTPTVDPVDEKFTRSELGAVQGQLRMLEQSFATVMLPDEAQQKLIEIAKTAAFKAEVLTKKDWQSWIIGSFISAIIGLSLTPVQAQDVLALIRQAFGGLFLNE